MKSVAGSLRLDLAQYRELAAFAQFGTADLDPATKAQLERGQRAVEVLKQRESTPLTLGQEITILFALANGHLDDVEISKVGLFEESVHRFMESHHPEILKQVEDSKILSDEIAESLTEALKEFKVSATY